MRDISEQYIVSFELYDFDFPVSDITKALNVQPTFKQTKGDPIKHRGTGKVLRYAETGSWSLASSLPPTAPVDEQFIQLLDLLRPHKDYLLQMISTELNCSFAVGGYTHDVAGKVGVNLSAKTIKEVSEYGADIDIDIYASSEG